ncbi:MAG: type IV pilus modification protein PilV, partial [Steroidobacteraceae bacterium]
MLTISSHTLPSPLRARGVSMLEVLVAIFILTVGLLGTAGIQSQMQLAEIEAYQRAQAIVLLQDMVDRVNANRKNADDYVTVAGTPLGTSQMDCSALLSVADKDKCDWNNALFGAAETKGGQTLGAMNGARGCITNPVAVMPREVLVAVAWQGMRPTLATRPTQLRQSAEWA